MTSSGASSRAEDSGAGADESVSDSDIEYTVDYLKDSPDAIGASVSEITGLVVQEFEQVYGVIVSPTRVRPFVKKMLADSKAKAKEWHRRRMGMKESRTAEMKARAKVVGPLIAAAAKKVLDELPVGDMDFRDIVELVRDEFEAVHGYRPPQMHTHGTVYKVMSGQSVSEGKTVKLTVKQLKRVIRESVYDTDPDLELVDKNMLSVAAQENLRAEFGTEDVVLVKKMGETYAIGEDTYYPAMILSGDEWHEAEHSAFDSNSRKEARRFAGYDTPMPTTVGSWAGYDEYTPMPWEEAKQLLSIEQKQGFEDEEIDPHEQEWMFWQEDDGTVWADDKYGDRHWWDDNSWMTELR